MEANRKRTDGWEEELTAQRKAKKAHEKGSGYHESPKG